MRQNSVNILIISSIILFYSLGGNGRFNYEEKYHIALNDDFHEGSHRIHRGKQPPAVLFDIDGDGEEELIMVSSALSLRIYSFQSVNNMFYGVSSYSTVNDVSLLSNSHLRSIDNIIAVAVDRIEIGNHLLGIIVIMSNNGIISCYDESLQLLWKISIYESNLINMSTLIVSNSALTISKQDSKLARNVIYVVISYSVSRKHFIKALNERLTEEELEVLKANKITLGSDIDLSQYQHHPQSYILEKYKSIFDNLNAINDIKVMMINAENGDFLWRNSIPHHFTQANTFSIHQPILGKYDSEHRTIDVSDFSQSSILFFPHMYRNYHDSSIVIQPYQRNAFQYRENYMDGPLRSLLPIQLFKSLHSHIHQNHGLTKTNEKAETLREAGNVVVVHTDVGIILFDKHKGNYVSGIVLATNQIHVPVSPHFDDIVSVFLSPQPFTGENNGINSYSRCYLQAVSRGEVLFSVNICGKGGSQENDYDEILVLQPLLILNPISRIGEKIITLTNHGLMTCISMKGIIEWTKHTGIRWSEFDETSDQQPFLSFVDQFIAVSGSMDVQFYSVDGKLVSHLSLDEPLLYPVRLGETVFGDTKSIVFQSSSSVVVFRPSNVSYTQLIRILIILVGVVIILYSVLSQSHQKEKTM